MASSQSLEQVFKSFCSFGSGSKDEVPMMDGAKFAKLCRDLKLLDKKLTPTDVDIIFSKCKQCDFMITPIMEAEDSEGIDECAYLLSLIRKTERKVTFKQFQEAVKLLAEKKYPGDPSGLSKLTTKITSGKGPTTSGTTKTVSSDVVDRMTDTSAYTGTHKLRFDEEGKGKGLEGRDSIAKGKGMIPGSVSGQTAYVSGYKEEGKYKSSPKTSKKSDIVDRLTDSSKYTGSHKHRFDESGHGKGLGGRDAPSKGAGMTPSSVGSQAAYVTGYRHEGTYGKKK